MSHSSKFKSIVTMQTGGGSRRERGQWGKRKETCIGVPDKRMRRVQGREANAYTLNVLGGSSKTKSERNRSANKVCISGVNLICQCLIIFQPVSFIAYEKVAATWSLKFWRMHAEGLIRYDEYLKAIHSEHIILSIIWYALDAWFSISIVLWILTK